jgi:hypothetical protein
VGAPRKMAKPTIKSVQPNWVGQPRFPNLSESFATAIMHWRYVSRGSIQRKGGESAATYDGGGTVRRQSGDLCSGA